MFGSWTPLIEVVALRRDADIFLHILLCNTSWTRAIHRQNTYASVQYVYVASFFDEVLYEHEWFDPRVCYYRNDKLHRNNGPAIEHAFDRRKEWFLNEKLHRVDGPAYESDCEKSWYTDGKLHRIGGPAVVYKSCFAPSWIDSYTSVSENGTLFEQWWIDGKRYVIVDHADGSKVPHLLSW